MKKSEPRRKRTKRPSRRRRGLSEREKRFGENLLIYPTIKEAAIRAGFAESTADKLAPLWIGKNREKSNV